MNNLPNPDDPKLTPYPIYQLALLCKDDSTAALDRIFKLYYYTHEHRPIEAVKSQMYLFGGLKPTNLYRDEESRGHLESYIQLITRFNVYLELGIHRKVVMEEGVRDDVFMIE